MIRVCFDTNIFISAFLFSGKPAKIFDLAVDKKIVLVTSPAILAEVAKVLEKKFNWDEQAIRKQLKVISEAAQLVVPKKRIKLLRYHPDNLILEVAFEGQVNFIVTGDKKHLLPLKKFKNMAIIPPAQFLRIFG